MPNGNDGAEPASKRGEGAPAARAGPDAAALRRRLLDQRDGAAPSPPRAPRADGAADAPARRSPPTGNAIRLVHFGRGVRRDLGRGRAAQPARVPIGQHLIEAGALDPGDLTRALALQGRQNVRLGHILITRGMVAEADVVAALAAQWHAPPADLEATPPDRRLVAALGAERCLRLGLVPCGRWGRMVVVACARPDLFADRREELQQAFGAAVTMAVASEADVARAIAACAGPALARRAETRLPATLSCRGWAGGRTATVALVGAGALALGLALAPAATLGLLLLWAALTLALSTALKAAGLVHAVSTAVSRRGAGTGPDAAAAGAAAVPLRLPTISVLVPLFDEQDIAGHLVARLSRLSYPHELMDVILLTEEGDATTRTALARARLPRRFRSLIVPPGTVRTKPRALNYGLPFCRGDIVGVWDAEDAPDPDQLHMVAAGFARSAPDVACLQGVLDFYNARANWLSRCFAVEYAVWFRSILPGLQALGLPLPLGGTTLFFRRDVLERLGGWDAHNVTEDADLGIRLARSGYRTEILNTVTLEEANCRPLPWIRQRSRWLKGYAMTWAIHMRTPRRTWSQLGPKGFLGFNALFLGTLSQFALAPLLMSFWLLPLGLPHPLGAHMTPAAAATLTTLFLTSEAISLALGVMATRTPARRHLMKWVPTLHLYFPLAALATYKALWELVCSPFYWDKTAHGVHGGPDRTAEPVSAASQESGGDGPRG